MRELFMLMNPPSANGNGASGLNVADVFSTDLWTGDGVSQDISNGVDLSTEGGMVWIKRRDGTQGHYLFDTERGAEEGLVTNSTAAESTESGSLTSFETDGYHLGSYIPVNANTGSIVGWTFRKAAGFFDVVTYEGTGSATTVSHNLGAVPGMIIVRNFDSVENWSVYHRSLGGTDELRLNQTAATTTNAQYWNDTDATDSVFSVGTNSGTNGSANTHVAYLFGHDPDGIIQCGSYAGNGSTTGPTVNLGWDPQFVMIKRSDNAGPWIVGPSSGSIDAGAEGYLFANATSTENAGLDWIDVTGSGFQIVHDDSQWNASGGTYIYMAIKAES